MVGCKFFIIFLVVFRKAYTFADELKNYHYVYANLFFGLLYDADILHRLPVLSPRVLAIRPVCDTYCVPVLMGGGATGVVGSLR